MIIIIKSKRFIIKREKRSENNFHHTLDESERREVRQNCIFLYYHICTQPTYKQQTHENLVRI